MAKCNSNCGCNSYSSGSCGCGSSNSTRTGALGILCRANSVYPSNNCSNNCCCGCTDGWDNINYPFYTGPCPAAPCTNSCGSCNSNGHCGSCEESCCVNCGCTNRARRCAACGGKWHSRKNCCASCGCTDSVACCAQCGYVWNHTHSGWNHCASESCDSPRCTEHHADYAVFTLGAPVCAGCGEALCLTARAGSDCFSANGSGITIRQSGVYYAAITVDCPCDTAVDTVFHMELDGQCLSLPEVAVNNAYGSMSGNFSGNAIFQAHAGSVLRLSTLNALNISSASHPVVTLTLFKI